MMLRAHVNGSDRSPSAEAEVWIGHRPAPKPAVGSLWAIVLAGGEGVRLRPLTRRVCGDERPKQYVPLLGPESMLDRTIDRAALVVPSARTVIVTQERHSAYMAARLERVPSPRVLVQPENRGTAAGVLFPAHWIHWQNPEATVAVFPSDHFIPDAEAFMAHVRAVAAFVKRRPEWIVVLGARPTEAETEYGWIEPGATLGRVGGEPISRVRRFWEKPSPEIARTALAVGCLWNTFVVVAKTATLLAEGRRALPQLSDRLSAIAPVAGSDRGAAEITRAYSLMSTANFSRAILEASPGRLAVSRLPRLTWSDWGTPARVLQSLRKAGIQPSWLGDVTGTAADAHVTAPVPVAL